MYQLCRSHASFATHTHMRTRGFLKGKPKAGCQSHKSRMHWVKHPQEMGVMNTFVPVDMCLYFKGRNMREPGHSGRAWLSGQCRQVRRWSWIEAVKQYSTRTLAYSPSTFLNKTWKALAPDPTAVSFELWGLYKCQCIAFGELHIWVLWLHHFNSSLPLS